MAADRLENTSDVMMAVMIRKLLQPASQSKAFRYGLIDAQGHQIKEPSNQTEKRAITSLDKLVWKLQRMLGTRINQLAMFAYLNSFPEEIEQYLYSQGSASAKTQVKRAKADLDRFDARGL